MLGVTFRIAFGMSPLRFDFACHPFRTHGNRELENYMLYASTPFFICPVTATGNIEQKAADSSRCQVPGVRCEVSNFLGCLPSVRSLSIRSHRNLELQSRRPCAKRMVCAPSS